jgi:hypothetical protein
MVRCYVTHAADTCDILRVIYHLDQRPAVCRQATKIGKYEINVSLYDSDMLQYNENLSICVLVKYFA